MKARERVLVALDTADLERALQIASAVAPWVAGFKVGLELFTAAGPEAVARLQQLGREIFLDLKLHDIPNTARRAARAAARLGVHFLTAHALGGDAMLRAAVEGSREGSAQGGVPEPRVLAVTVLTSLDARALVRLGLTGPVPAAVERLAALAAEAGCGGFVCSAGELPALRRRYREQVLVVPAIRPEGAISGDDQQRVGSPLEALRAGADRIVVGRPLTGALEPARAAEALARQLATGVEP